jgi:hypothetical protein
MKWERKQEIEIVADQPGYNLSYITGSEPSYCDGSVVITGSEPSCCDGSVVIIDFSTFLIER